MSKNIRPPQINNMEAKTQGVSPSILHTFPQMVNQLSHLVSNLDIKSISQEDLHTLQKTIAEIQNAVHALNQPAIRIVVDKIYQLIHKNISAKHKSLSRNAINTLQSQVDMLQQVTQIHLETDIPPASHENTQKLHHLIIGLRDKQLVEEIINQVKYFNYTSSSCDSLEEIIELINHHPPNSYHAILLDTEFCAHKDPALIKPISEKVPILFVSFDNRVATRLFAVRAGGSAYLVRPVEFTHLIEKIDHIALNKNEITPYRILIVEDSRTQAKFIQQQLENAGMITEAINNPMEINKILQEFQPELILMDLYMPECSGFELTKMIRQQEPYMSIPIVYLSAEADMDKQLHAIKLGGDDFLTKPMDPEHLVLAIQARSDRARTLRAEMIQDSLTGLLNHTRILEQLDLEIARAKRNHLPLSFAMIDIDYFKAINDNHGHPIGDRVIKGLARLLKQRLRKTDSIGRYGGEEFAIILPQTDRNVILPLLEDIRKGFSKLLHQSSDPLVEFTATVSCGLAEFTTTNNTVGKLVQAADKALYAAKSQGRNCVVLDAE
ncbi:MAG: diguanylate cyclase [Candidatus Berkiella sp.]